MQPWGNDFDPFTCKWVDAGHVWSLMGQTGIILKFSLIKNLGEMGEVAESVFWKICMFISLILCRHTGEPGMRINDGAPTTSREESKDCKSESRQNHGLKRSVQR